MLSNLTHKIDKTTVILYSLLVLIGCLCIYSVEFDSDALENTSFFSTSSGKQVIWYGISIVLCTFIYFLDHRIIYSFSYVFYGVCLVLVVLVTLFGSEVSGSRSWFGFAGLGIQPAEFAKFATCLALAKYLGYFNRKLQNLRVIIISFGIILLPAALILLQGDAGTSLIFFFFSLALFREELSNLFVIVVLGSLSILIFALVVNHILLSVLLGVITLIVIGLNFKNLKTIIWSIIAYFISLLTIQSVNFILYDVLKPHQQKRVLSLINPNLDPLGVGWNVTQSKIAIGSGGWFGKGLLSGTQTQFNFVPEQSTDFIFSSIGEEFGLIGSLFLLLLFFFLLLRLIFLAERQQSVFSRVFGYCVVSIIFAHFLLNIAMCIGLFPVIGIPLPLISYGGSSLITFSLMIFVFLKLDKHRTNIL